MDIITIIILLGIIQGIFVAVLLLTLNRGNRTANFLLGILMFLFSFSISGFFLMRIDSYENYPFLIGLPSTVLFLFGPLFYFYVQELTSGKFKFKRSHILHFIPFFILIMYKIPFFLKSPEEKINLLNVQGLFIENPVVLSIQIIHLFIYLFFTQKILKDYEKRIKSSMSSLEKINLNWINFGIKAFAIVFGVIAVFMILFFSHINIYSLYITLIPLLVSLAILSVGYFGLSQPIIITPEFINKPKRYEKSSLTDENSEKYLNRLLELMKTQKPFLDSNLTLQKLSAMVKISPHHLSQIINDKLDQNFFDFINCYRIEEAKTLLSDKKGELLTILAIAEEVGFNSKSSFNNAFKKCTSMTPSQFKKSVSSKRMN